MPPFPILDLHGSPRDVGRGHGESLRDAVAHNLDLYFRRFAAEAGVSRPEALERGVRYLATIDRLAPDYGQTLRGLAEGSGQPLAEIATLNARYEILYSEYAREEVTALGIARTGAPGAAPGADGCTAFAVMPEQAADGHLRLGQNWDWIPGVRGALLRVAAPDGLGILAFSEAGIAGGKIGLNSAGIGLTINGLLSDRDDWRRLGLPFHVRTWRALHARSLPEAVEAVRRDQPSCAANFLLGAVDGAGAGAVVDVELAPGASCTIAPSGGRLTHTNHFVAAAALGIAEPLEGTPTSRARARRIDALLAAGPGQLTPQRLEAVLADHEGYPGSICAHEDLSLPEAERLVTVCAVVLDLHRTELRVAAGNPCVTPFVTVGLAQARPV